jgi:hypothetical protein
MLEMDTNILQTKTVANIIEVLKLAKSITKSHTRHCKDINMTINMVIRRHKVAVDKNLQLMKGKEKWEHINY